MKSKIIAISFVFLFCIFYINSVSAQWVDVVWLPNSDDPIKGYSISKINATDGRELARYRTTPIETMGNPSRTAVDTEGNVWVGNRANHTAVKIGLLESAQCKDKNGNGIIDTSRDINEDGKIDGGEMLDFGADECLLYEVVFPGRPSDNLMGVRAVCADTRDNVYLGLYEAMKVYYVSKDGIVLKEWNFAPYQPYGCFVDRKGIVWFSSSNEFLVRFDPSTGNITAYNLGGYNYGITPCFKEDCLVISGFNLKYIRKFNTTTGTVIFTKYHTDTELRGIVVDKDENIYTIGRYTIIKCNKYGDTVKIVSRAHSYAYGYGLDFDGQGKLWATMDEGYAQRYDTDLNLELEIRIGQKHYCYSDFTGYVLRTICECTPWTMGGCVNTTHRTYTRTCTPPACSYETKYEPDVACAYVPPPPKTCLGMITGMLPAKPADPIYSFLRIIVLLLGCVICLPILFITVMFAFLIVRFFYKRRYEY